jgi:hypothetical protein
MLINRAFQAQWVPGILRPNISTDDGLRAWLLRGAWSHTMALTAKRATLLVHNFPSFADACANDVIALASAAFESATSVRVRSIEPRSCAWQVIAYYYAAYFAANSLMRLGGFVCTNLDVDVCAEINEQALLYGLGGVDDKSKFKPGVYYGAIASSGEFTLQSLAGVKGGVHIQFWAGFLKFLEVLDREISAGPLISSDRAAARAELKQLKDSLTRGNKGNGSWLSDVRNAVNYRFENGVWYPYSNNSVTGDELLSVVRGRVSGAAGLMSETAKEPDCSRLASVSGFLLRWSQQSLETIESSARYKKKSRIVNGPLSFSTTI